MTVSLGSAYGEILIDTSSLVASLKSAQRTMSGFERAMSGVGDTVAAVGNAVATGMAAVGASVMGLAGTAGRIESMRDALQGMADQYGFSVDEMIAKTKEASRNTLSESQIMQGALQAISLIGYEAFEQLGGFEELFPKLAETAKKASRVTGQEASFMFESILIGLGRTSPRWLDNTGVVVQATEAYDRWAAQAGVAAQELDATGQKTALLSAFLQRADELYGNVAVSSGGFAGSMSQLNTVLSDTVGRIGLELLPAVTPLIKQFTVFAVETAPKVIEAVSTVVEWFTALPGPVQTALGVMTALATAVTGARIAFGMLGPLLGPLAGALAGLSGPLGIVALAVGALGTAFATNFMGLRDKLEPVIDWIRGAIQGLVELFQAEGVVGVIEAFGERVYAVIERAFGTEVADRIATFVEDVRRGVEGLVGAFQEGGALAAVQEFGEQVYGVIERAFGTEVADKIATFVEDVRRGLELVKQGIGGIIEALKAGELDTALAKLQELGQALLAWIEPVIPIILQKLQELGQKLLDWASEQVPKIIEGLSEWGTALVDWIGPKIPPMLAKLGELASSLLGWVGEQAPKLAVKLLEWGTAFVGWIGPKIHDLLIELGKFLGKILTWIIGTAVPEIIKKGVELAKALINWITDTDKGAVAQVPGALKTFLEAIATFVTKSLIPGLIGFGKGLVGGLVEGLAQAAEKLDLTTIGRDIVDSIKRGIAGAWGAIKTILEELVSKLPSWIRGPLGMRSPSPIIIKIGKEIMESLAIGFGEGKTEVLKAIADVIQAIAGAFKAMADIVPTIAEFPALTGFKAGLGRLIEDTKAILVAVREELLDLWGWAGERKDTVWGHMISWAEAVKGVVEVIGLAATTFTEAARYTGLMPGVAERLAADIKQVVVALVGAIGDGGEIDQLKVEWMEFAGSLIGLVVGMIDDLAKLAGYEGGLVVSTANVLQLVGTLQAANDAIVAAFVRQPPVLNEAYRNIQDFIVSWVKLSGAMVSALVGVIGDLTTLSEFEGGLEVSQQNIVSLRKALDDANDAIVAAFVRQPPVLNDAYKNIVDFIVSWMKMAGAMVSALAGVIGDLTTLAGFKGGLEVSGEAMRNLVWTMNDAVFKIVEAMGDAADIASMFDEEGNVVYQIQVKWAEFSAKLVGLFAGMIEDITALAGFEGGLEVSGEAMRNLVGAMNQAVTVILEAIGDVSSKFDEAGRPLDALKAAWLEFQAGLVSTVAGVIEDMKTLVGYKGTLEISHTAIGDLVEQLGRVADAILEKLDITGRFDEAGNFVDALKVKWAEISTGLVGMIAGAASDLASLADYAPDQAKLAAGIELFFVNLGWFLAEFDRRAVQFAARVSEQGAETAKLIGETVGSLGQAVKPLLDLAEFAITPDQAAVSATLFFGSLETFLIKFAEKAADFEGRVSEETAELARIIGDTVKGIGDAVDPLIKILEYKPEVKDIEKKFEEFFYHLERALYWIEWQKEKWVVSDAALELSKRVSQVIGYLKTAVDFLQSMANYAEKNVVSGLTGFLAFITDLERVVVILEKAREKITDEALAAAQEFASGCAKMLSHITDGIDTLNSLPTMELDFYQGGYKVGVGFIQGMIDGLVNNASALYRTVMDIVAAAIAAAEAAAGAASPSREMWALGENMVAGLVGALQAGRSDVARVMAGLLADVGAMALPPAGAAYARAQAAPAMGGARFGGQAGMTQYIEYHYHEADGIGADMRASLRQEFEAMELYQRVRR